MKGKMMNRQSIPAFAKLFFAMQLLSIAALAQMPALSPLPGTASLSQAANPTQFTFVLAGDNRPAHSGDPQSAVPGNIFCAGQKMEPPAGFVLVTGDTIPGKDPQHPKRMHDQYKEFLGIAARAGVPVFNAPGNHEMDDSNETPSKTMKDLYRKYMAGTYGAFSYETGVAIAECAIRPGHVLSVEVLHGLGWRLVAVIHFMIARRVEVRNAGAGGDAQKFLVLIVHALGVLRVFSGDGIPGPEHEGRGRIHSLYSAEDVSRNGGLRIAGV